MRELTHLAPVQLEGCSEAKGSIARVRLECVDSTVVAVRDLGRGEDF